ncbi:PepSY-associated TM helix domain-containing protein [Luteimonas suaedae]|uniref:PepSY-associated TM helix domain-containing protein n=1 Tax=Luteimonas suaedae TaxID=2605430 RepID=UPI0011EEE7CC|nr:PepSY-associated TM helix domain-containing protein [Luteimonas suaedae]
MQRRTLKAWFLVHKWTSLVCTVFLLLLCLTGLPLIFGHEIGHLTGAEPEVDAPAEGARPMDIDVLLQTALDRYPGELPLFFGWYPDDPLVYVNTGPTPDTPPASMHTVVMHAYTGEVVPAPQFNEGVMWLIYRLHTDLFAGLPGTLFLGAMTLLFATAIVSGVVLYAPFMRKLPFGTIRTGRGRRLAWLDLHNVLGIVTLAWALVVGLTGAINTLATPLSQMWQADALAQLADADAGNGPASPADLTSLAAAVSLARSKAPDMKPAFVSFPGTGYSGDRHLGVFLVGDTPLTSRLYSAVLVDAANGSFAGMPARPGYITALLVSQPLHFGDYGGLPLKIVWALLDLITIVVLVSGLVLWVRRGSTESRVRELEAAQRAGLLAGGRPR